MLEFIIVHNNMASLKENMLYITLNQTDFEENRLVENYQKKYAYRPITQNYTTHCRD